MDKVCTYLDMPEEEFQAIKSSFSSKDSKHTLMDRMVLNYVERLASNDKFILDWLDRHVGKAPNDAEQSDSIDLNNILESLDHEIDPVELERMLENKTQNTTL